MISPLSQEQAIAEMFVHPTLPNRERFTELCTTALCGRIEKILEAPVTPEAEYALDGHALHMQHGRAFNEKFNLSLLDLSLEEEAIYDARAGKAEFVPDNIVFLQRKATQAFEVPFDTQSFLHEGPAVSKVRKITLEMLGCIQNSWADTRCADDTIWFLPDNLRRLDSEANIRTYEYDTDFAINEHTKYSVWPILSHKGPVTPDSLAFAGVMRRRATLDYNNVQVFKESRGVIVLDALPLALRKRLAPALFATKRDDEAENKNTENKEPENEETEWAVATAGILFFNATRLKDDDHKFVVPTSVKILASAVRQDF